MLNILGSCEESEVWEKHKSWFPLSRGKHDLTRYVGMRTMTGERTEVQRLITVMEWLKNASRKNWDVIWVLTQELNIFERRWGGKAFQLHRNRWVNLDLWKTHTVWKVSQQNFLNREKPSNIKHFNAYYYIWVPVVWQKLWMHDYRPSQKPCKSELSLFCVYVFFLWSTHDSERLNMTSIVGTYSIGTCYCGCHF